MSIEDEIAKLTQSTNELLDNVMTKKATLDTAVSDATTQASLAATEKVSALGYRNEAEGFKDQAYTYSATAEIEADRAKSEADNASAVVSGGTATLNSTAGSIPLADSDGVIDASWLPAEITGRNVFAEEQAIGNAKYAASGFVHMGRARGGYPNINQGLWTSENGDGTGNFLGPNLLRIGAKPDSESPDSNQVSKTSFARVNIAGIETELGYLNSVAYPEIRFPDAPNGTVTYDSATGTIVDYTTDVDPKYGDVAADTNEAVARAFEGVFKNGDFRLGDAYWALQLDATLSVTDGVATITRSSGSSNSGVYQFTGGIDNNSSIKVSFTILSGALKLNVGGSYVESNIGVGTHTLTFGARSNGKVDFFPQNDTPVEISNVSVTLVTEEVVTERVDMFGFEGFLEEVTATNPYVYPNGLIQSQANTMDGVTTGTSNRPVTYYAVFDGDETSRGKGVNFLTASDANKRKMFSNPKNNLYWIEGKLYQWRVRQRTIAGAGNGDWVELDSATSQVFRYSINSQVQLQGDTDYKPSYINAYLGAYALGSKHVNIKSTDHALFHVEESSSNVSGIKGECYFLVCGAVPRLNQGAYHPSFNPMGTAKYAQAANIGWATSWYSNKFKEPTSKNDSNLYRSAEFGGCRIKFNSGNIGGAGTDRPDGKFYDAIYASGQGGVIDYRLSAWDKSSPAEAAKVDAMVKNGSYRGVEKLVFSKVEETTYLLSDFYFAPNTFVKTEIVPTFAEGLNLGQAIEGYIVLTDGTIYKGKWYSAGTEGRFRLDTIYGDVTSSITYATGDALYAVGSVPKDISVSGEFTQTDVIGDPANILANPALKDGWMGSWNPALYETGQPVDIPFVRKSLDSTYAEIRTTNYGDSYTYVSGVPIDTISNSASRVLPDTNVTCYSYTAFAKQTKVADNEPVFNGEAGLGSVFLTTHNNTANASLLAESLVGKVLTDNSDQRKAANVSINEIRFEYNGIISTSNNRLVKHESYVFGSPNNNSFAVKALNYQVESNQQLGLGYLYEELVHNGTDWGDDLTLVGKSGQTTNTDDNGNTVLTGTATLAIPYGWVKNKV